MILLTGASGYLGRHVLAKLEAGAFPYMATSRSGVVGTACDLTNPRETQALLERVQPTTVIHCAAYVPKTLEDYDDEHPADASERMCWELAEDGVMVVLASSLTAADPSSAYARGKVAAELAVSGCGISMRLPGLFGLPRRNGRIYQHCIDGSDYGTEPAMHVQDAAEYLVRAAIEAWDGPEPISVTYGDPRLERVYGSLGVTFEQRVQEFVEQLREVPA